MHARVADLREVAVAREAHVVELDLVEAELRRLGGDVDVVLPDALVVGVRPPEPGAVEPARAVRAADRQLGRARREDGILEGDDAADQIEARGMDLGDGALGVVVGLRGADLLRERNVDREADLAVLVLDVELDRVEPADFIAMYSSSLPGSPARAIVTWTPRTSSRQRSRLEHLRLRCLRRSRGGAHRLVPVDVRRDHAADDAGRDQREQRAGGDQPPLVASLLRFGPPHLGAGVRIDRLEDIPGRQGVEN